MTSKSRTTSLTASTSFLPLFKEYGLDESQIKKHHLSMWPYTGTTGLCYTCGTRFVLCAYRRKNVRLGKHIFCGWKCQNAWHRSTFNSQIGKRAAKKIGDTKRKKGDATSTWYRKVDGRHEHRTVAEKILGRKLTEKEIVHHIDGDKRNNAPENLQVMTQAEHFRLHSIERWKRDRSL